MIIENKELQAEYDLAVKLIGSKAYCWKKDENTCEIGERVPEPNGKSLKYKIWGTGSTWEEAIAQVKKRYKQIHGLKKSNKMSTLKIKNPKNDSIIYVHPCQEISLELSFPDNPIEDDDWNVNIYSDYLAMTSSGVFNQSKIYKFTQLYDLTSWSKVSSVQIAEIFIQWKGLKRDKYTNHTIYVVLQGQKAEQRDVVTVINPICAGVRIGPHQLLEVIVFENNTKSTTINHTDTIDFCIEPDKPYLEIEKIATKHVTHVLENAQYRDLNEDPYFINRHILSLPVNPRLTDGSPLNPVCRRVPTCTYQATHFFYRIARHCIPDIQNLANGIYKASEVLIASEENTEPECSLDVYIGIKGLHKPKLRAFGQSKLQQTLIKTNNQVDYSNIGKRVLAKEHFYEKGRLLLNPDNHDTVEFVSDLANYLTIEVAPPHFFNSRCPVTTEWVISADPVWQFRHHHEPKTRLTIGTAGKRIVGDTGIQRFNISPAKGYNDNMAKHMFLGIVKLSVPGFKAMTRCISFYIIAGAKSFTSSSNYSNYASQTVHIPTVPKRMIIKFQEFCTNDLLVTGAISKKFTEIEIENAVTTFKKKKKTSEDYGPSLSEK